MSAFFKDIRYAARMLASTPGFTAAAAICLALGIGSTTAIFSVVHAVLLRPLSYREPERLVLLYTEFPKFPNGGLRRFWMSAPEYDELTRDLVSWESLDAWATGGVNLAGITDPIRVTTSFVTGGLFSSLGVAPALGRTITPEDDIPGAPQVVVISHGLWERAFGSDPAVLGRVVQVDGRNANIIGVMRPGFTFPPGELDQPDLWTALQLGRPDPKRRGNHFLYVIGRLKTGVPLRQAQEDLTRHVRQSPDLIAAADHPFSPDLHPIVSYPLHDEVVRGVRPALWMLMAAVAFVLLIACINVASLLLARAEARQREIAIRKALGASLGRLIRQFTVEGLVLSLTGAALGLLLAVNGLKLLIAAGTASIPRALEVRIDSTVLGVTLAGSLAAALFFGLAPLAQIATGAHDALKAAGGSAASSASSKRFRSALVAIELALALVLLIGTGLMVRAFWKLSEVDPGFRPQGLLTVLVNLPRAAYPRDEQAVRFWRAVQAKAAAIPGVQSATALDGLPPQRRIDANDTQIENFTPMPGGPRHNIDFWQVAGDRFFETLGARLIEGRFFDARDGESGVPSVIINQTMARVYYGDQSALGHRVRPAFADPWRTIVGVVADLKNGGLDRSAGTELFLPYLQGNQRRTCYLVIRTAGDPRLFVSAVRQAVREIDPSLPLSHIQTMDEVLAGTRSRPRFLATLLGLFSSAALVLAAVGLYGVISYSVTRRTTEFGVRMAMGAGASDVLGLVLRHGLRLAALGIAAGALGAMALTRFMRGLLFGISAFDPATFGAMAVLLVAVTLAACLVPARRAATVEPLAALRYE